MDFLTYSVIGIGLSFDSFAASVCAGASAAKSKIKIALKVAFILAIFQGGAPFFGWLLGIESKVVIKQWDHWAAFILLLLIGGNMIYDSFKRSGACGKPFIYNFVALIGVGVATSVDALIVGVSFGLLGSEILTPMLIIFFVTFVFSFAGVLIGNRSAQFLNKKAQLLGGVVLIGIGAKILIEHTVFQ